jgi:hypothetical protein
VVGSLGLSSRRRPDQGNMKKAEHSTPDHRERERVDNACILLAAVLHHLYKRWALTMSALTTMRRKQRNRREGERPNAIQGDRRREGSIMCRERELRG